jgi:hypothetical protein
MFERANNAAGLYERYNGDLQAETRSSTKANGAEKHVWELDGRNCIIKIFIISVPYKILFV